MTAILVFLSWCKETGADTFVDVAISNKRVQCESTAVLIEQSKRYLLDDNIAVLSQSCGVENKMVAFVCGSPMNQIHIFKIKEKDLLKAQEKGFVLVSNMPDGYKYVDCDSLNK